MQVAIIGGGIGGLTTAVALHKIGIDAHVYEQASAFRPIGAGIGIGSNAMVALQKIGVATDVLKAGMPLYEQRFLNDKFAVMNTIDFSLLKEKFGEETIAIGRAELHAALFHALDRETVHFNYRVTDFQQHHAGVTVTFNDEQEKMFDYVIAADGIHSMFRKALVPGSEPCYANYTCWRGISKNNGEVLDHVSSEAWSSRGRFGFAPLANGDVYWFACVNASKADEYYASMTPENVAHLFRHYPKMVSRFIEEVEPHSFLHHDLYDIAPLSTFHYGRILLLGDAAHATTPKMGQGAGQAIEDAYEFMCALEAEDSIVAAFRRFDKARVEKTKKVITLSRQIGSAAQWDNRALVAFRNTVFPLIPTSLLFWRLTFLFK